MVYDLAVWVEQRLTTVERRLNGEWALRQLMLRIALVGQLFNNLHHFCSLHAGVFNQRASSSASVSPCSTRSTAARMALTAAVDCSLLDLMTLAI